MRFVFLGTSGSIPSAVRDTTSIVVVVPDGAVLIDCGGSPVQKLRRAGVDPQALTAILITHIHPDHSYGLPALVRNLAVLGRQAPLTIFCRPEHVEPLRVSRPVQHARARACSRSSCAPSSSRKPPTLRPRTPARADSPNDHGAMPNFAVRMDVAGRGSVVYSSDTRPCDAVVALARGADTLIHEATYSERDPGRVGGHALDGRGGRRGRGARRSPAFDPRAYRRRVSRRGGRARRGSAEALRGRGRDRSGARAVSPLTRGPGYRETERCPRSRSAGEGRGRG